MGTTNLKPLTIYLSPEEAAQIAEEAADHGVTVSGYVRARLGFQITTRGAPQGNQNRQRAAESSAPVERTKRRTQGTVKRRRN